MVEETTLYALRCYARACLIPQPHTRTPKRMLQPVAGGKKKRSSFQLLHSSGGLPPQKCTFSPGSLPPQKKRLRRFSFQLTHSSGNLPPQKTTEGVACKCRIFIWEPATAKTSRISSLQLSHFHLGACHRKKKGKEGFVFNCHTHLGACHRKTVKNRQLAAVTFSPGSLPPKKKVKKV